MRRLLTLALCLLSLPAFAQPIQSNAISAFGLTQVDIPFDSATTPGNLIIAGFGSANATDGEDITSVTDEEANSYTQLISGLTDQVTIWCTVSANAVSTVSGTVATPFTALLFVFEFDVADYDSCTTQESNAYAELDGGAFQASHTLPYVTVEANELVIGLIAPHAQLACTGTNGTTCLTDDGDTTTRYHMAYEISGSAESSSLTWDWGAAGTAHGMVVSLSPAAAAGTGANPITGRLGQIVSD